MCYWVPSWPSGHWFYGAQHGQLIVCLAGSFYHFLIAIIPRTRRTVATMTKPTEASFPFDKEWATGLVGLRVALPNYWWPKEKGNHIHKGKIAFIDPLEPNGNYFAFQLDATPQHHYGLTYAGVVKYADATDDKFARYHLPAKPPANPELERAATGRRGRRSRPRQPNFSPNKTQRVRTNKHKRRRVDDDPAVEDVEDDDDDATAATDATTDSEDEEVVVEATDPKDWILVTEQTPNNKKLPKIEPIPYQPRAGEGKDFELNLTEDDVESSSESSLREER